MLPRKPNRECKPFLFRLQFFAHSRRTGRHMHPSIPSHPNQAQFATPCPHVSAHLVALSPPTYRYPGIGQHNSHLLSTLRNRHVTF